MWNAIQKKIGMVYQRTRRQTGMVTLGPKKRLRSLMGSYRESKYEAATLFPNIEDAIARASKLDIKPDDRWPQTVGTRVYLLVNSILAKDQQ